MASQGNPPARAASPAIGYATIPSARLQRALAAVNLTAARSRCGSSRSPRPAHSSGCAPR